MVLDTDRDRSSPADRTVLQRVATTALRLIPILVVAAAALYAAGVLWVVVVPLVLALFPAALLEPPVRWLRRHGVNSGLAAALAVVVLLAVLFGGLALLVPTFAAQLPALSASLTQGVGQVQQLAAGTPLEGLIPQGPQALAQLQGQLTAGGVAGRVFGVLSQAVQAGTMALLLLIALFFYLRDGAQMSNWFRDLLPRHLRDDADTVGRESWATLGEYLRGQLLVGLADAVLIGVGLLVVGVPLVLPLAVLTFLGGLVPVVGAVLAGAAAVLVALASNGLTDALIVLAIVVAVQQIEGNLLQPVVQGRTLHLHPLAILVALTAGSVLLGILGTFLAVPVTAAVVRSLGALRE